MPAFTRAHRGTCFGLSTKALAFSDWAGDSFCSSEADAPECTNSSVQANTVADLQFRSTTALALNYLWAQNYITDGSDGSVQYDDMVVATERIGCLR